MSEQVINKPALPDGAATTTPDALTTAPVVEGVVTGIVPETEQKPQTVDEVLKFSQDALKSRNRDQISLALESVQDQLNSLKGYFNVIARVNSGALSPEHAKFEDDRSKLTAMEKSLVEKLEQIDRLTPSKVEIKTKTELEDAVARLGNLSGETLRARGDLITCVTELAEGGGDIGEMLKFLAVFLDLDGQKDQLQEAVSEAREQFSVDDQINIGGLFGKQSSNEQKVFSHLDVKHGFLRRLKNAYGGSNVRLVDFMYSLPGLRRFDTEASLPREYKAMKERTAFNTWLAKARKLSASDVAPFKYPFSDIVTLGLKIHEAGDAGIKSKTLSGAEKVLLTGIGVFAREQKWLPIGKIQTVLEGQRGITIINQVAEDLKAAFEDDKVMPPADKKRLEDLFRRETSRLLAFYQSEVEAETTDTQTDATPIANEASTDAKPIDTAKPVNAVDVANKASVTQSGQTPPSPESVTKKLEKVNGVYPLAAVQDILEMNDKQKKVISTDVNAGTRALAQLNKVITSNSLLSEVDKRIIYPSLNNPNFPQILMTMTQYIDKHKGSYPKAQ